MDQIASWVATVATILAACFTASNLGSRITGIGFIIFTIGSLAWLATGALTGQPALVWTNVAMTVLNLFGVYRWLGRQAKLETGAEQAAAKSHDTPGEALFPASLLTSAKISGWDHELGTLVDAMVGCKSGRIAYLVVAEGGVAGVGETLRRVDWPSANVDDGAFFINGDDLTDMQVLQRDNWPAR